MLTLTSPRAPWPSIRRTRWNCRSSQASVRPSSRPSPTSSSPGSRPRRSSRPSSTCSIRVRVSKGRTVQRGMSVMVGGDPVLTPDFKTTPYWWEEANPPAAPDSLPAQADVVVVGSGFTGLSASLTLQQAGRQVLVLDAENLGAGASSRNAGSMGRTFRHDFSELAQTRGIDFATQVYREVHGAFQFAYNRIESEGIKCHLARRGRFTAFIGPEQYDKAARELELRQ